LSSGAATSASSFPLFFRGHHVCKPGKERRAFKPEFSPSSSVLQYSGLLRAVNTPTFPLPRNRVLPSIANAFYGYVKAAWKHRKLHDESSNATARDIARSRVPPPLPSSKPPLPPPSTSQTRHPRFDDPAHYFRGCPPSPFALHVFVFEDVFFIRAAGAAAFVV